MTATGLMRSMRRMSFPPDPSARVERLERQVAYLLRHLNIDPELAASEPAGFSASFDAQPFDAESSYAQPEPFGGAPQPFGGASGSPAGPAYPPDLIAALDQGKMINAIKAYRQWTGCGLAEAKQAVEAVARSR
jgi:hypothetical protein